MERRAFEGQPITTSAYLPVLLIANFSGQRNALHPFRLELIKAECFVISLHYMSLNDWIGLLEYRAN